MFLTAYIALLSSQFPVDAQAGENKLTQLPLKPTPQGLLFDWADADEALRGQVSPLQVRAGEPLTVSAVLRPLSGPEFDAPLTFSLRPLEAMGSTRSLTVERQKDPAEGGAGPRGWVAQFTPEDPGEYRLEISWRSTHHKVVRGIVQVAPRALPRWVTWAVGSGMIATALGIGLWILFGRKESAPS